jgi:hypothetical protein
MGLTKPRATQIYNLDYKQATRVVTVANITLSGGAPATVDGISLSVNDRVLVTAQSTGSQNGIYKVVTVGSGSSGTWVRTTDANDTGEIEAGMIVMVTEGLIYADTQWKLITDNPITLDSTALTFTQNYSANSISGGTSNVTVYSNANVAISSAGTPNVLIISSTGTVTSGTASVTGNITGSYIFGNGSQLTGITASSTYGNANVTSLLSAFGSNTISTTGNVTAGYFVGNGSTLTSITGGNITGTVANATYATSAGTATTAGTVTTNAQPNITSVGTLSSLSTSGNLNSGNILTGGQVSATGNITGSYILGNGSQLTGLPASYGDSNVVTLLASFGSNSISTTGNVTASNLNSSNADLAEMYVADADYPAGTVVEFGGNYEITVSNQSHSTQVAGIVSTDPSYLMNSAQAGKHVLAIALTGRVPCRVVGSIRKGDRLVACGLHAGTATTLDMQQYQPGCIIGKSLENYNSTEIGVIEVAVGRT